MPYFARHLEVVAGVAPEAAPLESFGVEEHHCVARLATVSARTGPECRAHPCLLLSATAVRCLPAYGPRQRTGAGHVLPRRGFPPHLGYFWWSWIRRAARLQRDLPPTPPRPSAGLDPHPASPQTASLLQARRAIHGYEDTASRRSGEYSVAPQLPATLRSLLPGISAYHHAGPVDGMCTTLEDAPKHVSYSWETTNCRQNATAR